MQPRSRHLPSSSTNTDWQEQCDSLSNQNARLQKENERVRFALEKSEANLKAQQERSVQFATLQRKLDDLEKVHYDGKKMHSAELERVKAELDKSRKLNKGQSDSMAQLKKQFETVESRNQELKKASVADQSEIKNLRHKLRVAEQEREQLANKQNEAADTKRAMHMAESKRRDEVQDKDRRIADLQKSLAAEKQKAISAESRLEKCKAEADRHAKEAAASQRLLQVRVEEAEAKARNAETAHDILQEDLDAANDLRVEQLERVNAALKQAAQEYGRLVASSVPSSTHTQSKLECASLQIRLARLERKLASSEDQVDELVNLVRQYKERSGFLERCLHDAELQLRWHSSAIAFENSQEHHMTIDTDYSLADDIDAFILETRDFDDTLQNLAVEYARATADLSSIWAEDLLVCYTAADAGLVAGDRLLEIFTNSLTDAHSSQAQLAKDLESAQGEYGKMVLECAEQARQGANAKTKVEHLNMQLVAAKEQYETQLEKSDDLVKKERQINSRLLLDAQQNKMAEEAMKAEIEQLGNDLADAEGYQEAYEKLVAEVGDLIDRNTLAEEETARLSKFNAEILGHRNPTQRIFYVDKIRRELADTKQKLLARTREHEAVVSENQVLSEELKMYKSVAVPFSGKPRTNITRVTRVPLASRNNSPNLPDPENESCYDLAAHLPQTTMGDMTLDDLI